MQDFRELAVIDTVETEPSKRLGLWRDTPDWASSAGPAGNSLGK
jgi:hypothetical protein